MTNALTCAHSTMTPSDWAAWVQAIGTLAAIGIAIWQAKRQHALALAELREDKALSRRAAGQNLHALASAALSLLQSASTALLLTPSEN